MKSINKKDISSYLYVIMMIVIFLLSANLSAQSFLENEIAVVEFNASWNEDNFMEDINKIKNCKSYIIILCDHIEYMKKFDLKQPTIVVFNNGEEVKRYISTIMLDFNVSYKDIQEDVDSLLLTKFN